MHLSSLNTP